MFTQQNVLIPDSHHVLTTLLGQYSQVELARGLGVSARTVHRWSTKESSIPHFAAAALTELRPIPVNKVADPTFRTIDLFAGIGGIRRGFERHGGECVFTSEWDGFAKKTYVENFGDDHPFEGDITKVRAHEIPDHDVLLGGFPCQPFSIAGVSKKNSLGRAHGFADATQGTLFFDVARIIDEKRPSAFLLENVKNLRSHDRGRTFAVVLETLEQELGYEIHHRAIDGGRFTPQHRERILIAGFREPTDFSWDDLQLPDAAHAPLMKDVLHRVDGSESYVESDDERFFDFTARSVHEKYTLSPKLWAYLQAYAAKHKAAGNGFGFGLTGPEGRSRTLSARYYKDGSEILINQPWIDRPRRLTPRECARLMGFGDDFRIPVSDTQAYKQFGNSVVVPVMAAAAAAMRPHILRLAKTR